LITTISVGHATDLPLHLLVDHNTQRLDISNLPSNIELRELDRGTCNALQEKLTNRKTYRVFYLPRSVVPVEWILNSKGQYVTLNCGRGLPLVNDRNYALITTEEVLETEITRIIEDEKKREDRLEQKAKNSGLL